MTGWTRHGHAIDGTTQTGPPPVRARCGGPRICPQCMDDAAKAKTVVGEDEYEQIGWLCQWGKSNNGSNTRFHPSWARDRVMPARGILCVDGSWTECPDCRPVYVRKVMSE